ncbi:MAG: peptide chain release factor N(5)-glutamine methyltransferase [Candidatus Caldatribacteriaceae bacterium]
MALVKETWKDLVKILRENQVLSPTREARLLLARLLHTSPSRVYLFWDFDLDAVFLGNLYAMLEERLRGVPLQYVLGEWEFLSLPFEIERGVFIPRFDTEAWVEEAILFLRLLAQREPNISICDVGCGSGVIGISCAFWVPDLYVFGIDISEKAVELSRKNAQRLGVSDRTSFVRSDLFEIFHDSGTRFDVILANPPYVPLGDWYSLSREIREYEPKEALVAGEDGLKVIWRIIEEGVHFLKEGGFFFIEHDPRQEESIQEKVRRIPLLEYVRSIEDYNGRTRASVLQKREEERK